MAKITIEELSDSLKEYLGGLGLTEEQVNSLVQNKLGDLSNLETLHKDNIVDSVNEVKDMAALVAAAIFGYDMSDDTLMTDSDTVIGAINELFQSANNGKQLIANAIGNESITVDSTFSAMSEAILELKEKKTEPRKILYEMMIEDGYNEATSEMTVDDLIDLLGGNGIDLSDVKQIVCGDDHTFILKNDGSLWACGYNGNGLLGLGDTTQRNTFTQVTTNINNDVKQIACGNSHTFILKNDGSLWSCGYNYYGQLGLGDTTDKSTFTQVTTNINNDVKQIACGGNHSLIIKTDGSVWSCGCNEYGQLGLGDSTYDQSGFGFGDITDRKTFTQITTNINNDVKQIACGERHTVILKNDGSIWGCGCNYDGELGLGTTTFIITTFTQATNISNVKQIACGGFHTYILKNDDSIWSCGYNNRGQLGLGTSDENAHSTFTQVTTNINNDVKQVACGREFTYILKNDDSIWSCGYNYSGQLGLGTSGSSNNKTTFTQVTTNINNDVKQIACGSVYAVILKTDGSIWGCGANSNGQLGLNDTTDRNTFTNTNFYTSIPEDDILALYNYLLLNNIPVTESMDIETMLNLLVDDNTNNTTLGYATGEGSVTFIITTESKPCNAHLDKPFGFTPTHIILVFDNGAILTNKTTSNNPLELNTENYVYIDSMTSDTLTFKSFSGMNQYSHDFIYYAFDANSSSSGGSGGSSGGITSYETVLIDSADLVQSNGYYNYSIESYDLNNISLILADVKAIDDDIGFMQYYSTILFPPSRPVGENTIHVGNYNGNGETSVIDKTSYTTIPIMIATDNFIEGSLIIFYKAGAVSNSLSPLSFNSETTTYHTTAYESIEFRTIDLNFVPGKFDYIAFEYYCHTNDADACDVNVVYNYNSKKCYYLIRGYYNYCYQLYDIPSNAIPIMQSDLSSPDNIDYTGYVANGASIG